MHLKEKRRSYLWKCCTQVVYLNVVWLLAATSLPIYSLPVPSPGALPEHKIYMRLMYPDRAPSSMHASELHKKKPAYIQRGLLFSKNGYLLRIKSDGSVDGTSDKASPYARLEFHSVGTGLLMIMGVSTNRYLSISDAGVLCGTREPSLNSIFEEIHEENMFHSYISYKHKKDGWLIGLKKNGKAKKATLTAVGQKSTQFLPTYQN